MSFSLHISDWFSFHGNHKGPRLILLTKQPTGKRVAFSSKLFTKIPKWTLIIPAQLLLVSLAVHRGVEYSDWLAQIILYIYHKEKTINKPTRNTWRQVRATRKENKTGAYLLHLTFKICLIKKYNYIVKYLRKNK